MEGLVKKKGGGGDPDPLDYPPLTAPEAKCAISSHAMYPLCNWLVFTTPPVRDAYNPTFVLTSSNWLLKPLLSWCLGTRGCPAITQIYLYLRILYVVIGHTHCTAHSFSYNQLPA